MEKGFSLFEVLIAISVFAVIGVLAAQLIGISLQSEEISGNKTIAFGLTQETAEAVDAIAKERWQGIYGLTKGSATHYYTSLSGSKWATSTGDEVLTLNDVPYRRYFFVENVSRNGSGDIVDSGGNDDPSTQKVTIVASWENSGGVTIGTATTTKYLMRARNTSATQTDWASSGGTAPGTGEDQNFNTSISASENINFSVSGEIRIQ